METSYAIPDYHGKVVFGLITKGGRIKIIEGDNSQSHIELFGEKRISECDRFRIINDDIYITYRASRTRDAIREVLQESFPGKTVKKYKVLIAAILNKKRGDDIEKTSQERGIGRYLASLSSGIHDGD